MFLWCSRFFYCIEVEGFGYRDYFHASGYNCFERDRDDGDEAKRIKKARAVLLIVINTELDPYVDLNSLTP